MCSLTAPVMADRYSPAGCFGGGAHWGSKHLLPPSSSSRRYRGMGLPPTPTESPTASMSPMDRFPYCSSPMPPPPRGGSFFEKANATGATGGVCETARESTRVVTTAGSGCLHTATESLGRCVYFVCVYCLHGFVASRVWFFP